MICLFKTCRNSGSASPATPSRGQGFPGIRPQGCAGELQRGHLATTVARQEKQQGLKAWPLIMWRFEKNAFFFINGIFHLKKFPKSFFSLKRGTPKSSMKIRTLHEINHLFLGYQHLWNPPMSDSYLFPANVFTSMDFCI